MKRNEHYSRRDFLRTSALTSCGLLMSPLQGCKHSERPNLLFIMADDHTSQAFGCYGSRLAEYAPTQNIDRLAREGARLQNCFCTNSICVPSRASILTGQYSHVNGVKTLRDGLGSHSDNVAKHLQKAGYSTAVIGKWHLKQQPGGFDYYNVLRGQGRYHDPVLFASDMDWQGEGREYSGHSTDVITNIALKWLADDRDRQKPFFSMVHFKAVHEPFYSHDRYRSLYSDIDLPEPGDLHWQESPKDKVFDGWPLEILGSRFQSNPGRYAPPGLSEYNGSGDMREAVYQKFIKDYLRGVAGLDENVGRILDFLEENQLSENTVVIYTSDQGYFLGEHNMFDKRFMLEESLRMPFVVRYPEEIVPGTVLQDIILNTDFAALFLDYAGAPVPGSMQGRSFRRNLSGHPPDDWRQSMYYRYWTNSVERPAHYGIRTHNHKLIHYYGLLEFGRRPEECWELYDLQHDPHELQNVYKRPENRTLIQELKEDLQNLRSEVYDMD
jgi:arylsulfatase A-like enzyme